MGNRKAKQGSGNQSIVRHPLFPTVVAFWFAALFGLGSLAVRTSLLESLVIASKIDLIVPQTAPPLGITARILIALGMAAIGSILGFVIALRVARPKLKTKHERVRTVGQPERETAANSRTFAAEARERAAEPERRRALLASDEGDDPTIFDDGPSFLTGMAPHILDVTDFEFDPIDRQPAEAEEAMESDTAAPTLELDQFHADEAEAEFDTFAEEEAAAVEPERAEVPFEGEPEIPAPRQSFDAPAAMPAADPLPAVEELPAEARKEEPVAEFAADAQQAYAPRTFAAPVTSPLQFTVPAMAPTPSASLADNSPVPAEPATMVEAPATAPEADFGDPLAAFRNGNSAAPAFDGQPVDNVSPEAADASFPELVVANPEPEAEPEALAAEVQSFPPMGESATRLMNTDLSDLSPVELIERLALSLQRKGRVATVARAPATVAAPASAPAAAPAQMVQPEAPASSGGQAPSADRKSYPWFTLPQAMQPIDFAQYEQEDDLPHYVPARSIAGQPVENEEPVQSEQEAAPAGRFAAPQPTPAPQRFGRPVEQAPAQPEEDVLEAGYSSLLDMSKPAGPRHQPVRVIDPEADTEAPEPVVIFPGQTMRAGVRFAQPTESPVVVPSTPPASLAETPVSGRRFDAPPVPGQPAAGHSPEETELALRSALATLQRMSGAA